MDEPTPYLLEGSWQAYWDPPYVYGSLGGSIQTTLQLIDAGGVIAEIECVTNEYFDGCSANAEMRSGVLPPGTYTFQMLATASGSPGTPPGYGEYGASVHYDFRLDLDPPPVPALGWPGRVIAALGGALASVAALHRVRSVHRS